DREFRVISALHAQGFPVAAPVLYCADADVIGTPFYLMAHVDGRVIWEPHMPDAAPAARTAVFEAMNATLAQLHSFDPAQSGLGDVGRGEISVARQVEPLSGQYRAAGTGTIAGRAQLSAWRPAPQPQPAPVRLVRGACPLDNIILSPSAPWVLAVLDCEL